MLNACLRGFVIRRAHGIHLHTARFAENLVKQGVEKKRIYVIPHGSFAPLFLPYRQDGVKREPLVLFFGRLEYYKGLDLFVEAGLLTAGGLRFAIAGPGKLSPRIVERIKTYPDIFEIYNRYLTEVEVAHLFQRASVCVLPYRQATQSSVPLIAAAFGVPVVATALGGFLDDVPRVNGVLVPPGDVKRLVQGIGEALNRNPRYPQELEFTSLAEKFAQWYNAATADYREWN
jgi:glycosyltransferase involved in cell wall biosynthesis